MPEPHALPGAPRDASPADAALAAGDAEARRVAKRDYARPLALEAGAGTGKTATLVARVVCWVLGEGWREARAALVEGGDPHDDDAVAARALEGVVAITFTEAAAAEMAERCARAFGELAAGKLPIGLDEADGDWAFLCGEGDPSATGVERVAVQRRAAALLEAQESLATRTIHAFCRSVLARHPLEARLAPGFEVDADGSRAEGLAREVLEEHLRDAWREPVDEGVLALLTLGMGPPELELALLALHRAGAHASDLADDPFGADRVRAFFEETRRRYQAVRAAGIPRLRDAKFKTNKNSPHTLQAFLDSEAVLGEPTPRDEAELHARLAALLAPWDRTAMDRLGDWAVLDRKQKPKSDFEALQEGVALFAGAADELHRWLKHVLRVDVPLLSNARRVLGGLLEALEERLTRSGVASFETLLSATEDLLERHPGIAAEERRRMGLLLVDEFQDTDQTQCAIVRTLALAGPTDERPSLFLVGDPKQSIYGWRRADLAAYEHFLGEVEEAGGRRLPLAVNFRSVPAVLDEVRRLVEPIMLRAEGLQPEFQPLLPRSGAADDPDALAGDRRHVEHWLSWVADPKSGRPKAGGLSEATFELEAAALAADLAQLHAGGLPWSGAAVLVRASTSLDRYLEAFRSRGIPYEVRGDKNYYRRREVVDAIALVRAVLDPNDHLALVALLRSPWVGVPDAAFGPLFAAGGHALFEGLTGDPDRDEAALARLATLGPRLVAAAADVPGIGPVAGFDLALLEAARAIGASRRAFEQEPADRFVEALRTRFLPEPQSAARFQGEWRLPNLARFFRELTEALDAGEGDAHAVLRRLRTDLANQRDAEEARPLEASRDAVQVMTIHRSKGLDFQHVYLPQLHKGQAKRAPSPFAFERRNGRAQYCLFGAPTLEFADVEERALRTEAAERVRLFYVATTRAKERLVLMSDWPDSDEAKGWADAGNFAELLPHRTGRRTALLELREVVDRAARGAEGEALPHSIVDDGDGTLWRLLAHLPHDRADRDGTQAAEDGQAPPDFDALLARAAELRDLRPAARRHARRPFRTRASDAAHAALAELRAAGDEPEAAVSVGPADPAPAPAAARDAARIAGTAVHAALERLPLDTPAAEAPTRIGDLALEALAELLEGAGVDADEARRRVRATCAGLAGGALLTRLLGPDHEVLARELPVLLAPPDHADASGTDGDDGVTDPVGYVSGSVDLVLRERASGTVVVVDYKSDDVDPAEAGALAGTYGPQLRAYGRALREGLGLSVTPRLEAWLLALDRAEEVAGDADPSAGR